ncbi:MAG TPA: cytochrome c, partial [Anaerolineae bacterium]
MARRLFILVGVVSLLFFNVMTARADDPPGAKLYATYCGACHGAAGKGGFAPGIGSSDYLTAKDDATLVQITGEGKAGSGMPAWNKSKGGTLTDNQIRDIVAYLRSLALSSSNAPAPVVSTPVPILRVFMQTKMTLVQSANVDGRPVVNVNLKEYNGNPVGGVAIAFTRATMFGAVDLGIAKTDAAGNASFIVDDVRAQARQLIASFKGEKDWDSSEAKIEVELPVVASAQNVDLASVRLDINEPLLSPEGSLITPNPP